MQGLSRTKGPLSWKQNCCEEFSWYDCNSILWKHCWKHPRPYKRTPRSFTRSHESVLKGVLNRRTDFEDNASHGLWMMGFVFVWKSSAITAASLLQSAGIHVFLMANYSTNKAKSGRERKKIAKKCVGIRQDLELSLRISYGIAHTVALPHWKIPCQ